MKEGIVWKEPTNNMSIMEEAAKVTIKAWKARFPDLIEEINGSIMEAANNCRTGITRVYDRINEDDMIEIAYVIWHYNKEGFRVRTDSMGAKIQVNIRWILKGE